MENKLKPLKGIIEFMEKQGFTEDYTVDYIKKFLSDFKQS